MTLSKRLVLLLCLVLAQTSVAAVYQCRQADGRMLFTDSPCAPDALSSSVTAHYEENLGWGTNVMRALVNAELQNKRVLIAFDAKWCAYCKEMRETTYKDPAIKQALQNYVTVWVDVDQYKDVALQYNSAPGSSGGGGVPSTLILAPSGREVFRRHGLIETDDLLQLLRAYES